MLINVKKVRLIICKQQQQQLIASSSSKSSNSPNNVLHLKSSSGSQAGLGCHARHRLH
jgi:hypothetical protein